MQAPTLRIIESDEEASLHPRAIWNHWKKNVIWDPRSYYGVLEFFGMLVIYLLYMTLQDMEDDVWYRLTKFTSGLLLSVPIAILHWYSNNRRSASILTRSKTHLYTLLFIAVKIFVSQLIGLQISLKCRYNCELRNYVDFLLWLSILILFWTSYVVYTLARNPRKDPILAELPSPIDLPEDESQRAWASLTIADGIEDDSLEPEGQLRL
ncbi:hypothetical protein CVT25_002620 [Psilocybe cyanescens]|uniref:Uncharacterized protein n=1 Tax=Psilocybe cyanescens TaxID=93625 RepID=A0A409WLQ9_PSICY|nr:hypothetical protein CVT25_002620 [Psilocybe cyanescens]